MSNDHTTNIVTRTENDATLDAAKRLLAVETVVLRDARNGVPREVLSVPDGRKVHSVKALLDEYLTAPERRKGTARFTDLDSFIAHTNRFRDTDSAIFADDSKGAPALLSVLDYHRATADGAPRFGEHRGAYAFPLSDEWTAWTAQNGKPMSQVDFARFLEDRLVDVADPSTASGSAADWAKCVGAAFASPSKLLELSRGLAVRVNAAVRGQHDIGSGATQVMFATEHTDINGAPIDVPGAFLLAIPVFKRGDLYPVPVRLRYRVKESVTWHYELARVDAVFEHAFGEACALVAEKTSLPVLRGNPEA